MADSDDITQILAAVRDGDSEALDRLFEVVYQDLRHRAHLQRAGASPTLNTTALVHEAYLKLAGAGNQDWNDRQHFFRVAARAMRQIVIDRARQHRTAKRGGGAAPVTLDELRLGDVDAASAAETFMALDAGLSRLADQSPRLAQVVELRFFGGLSVEDTAATLEMSTRTVKRDWRLARAFLHQALSDDAAGSVIPLDPERWARVESLFHEAAELEENQRAEFLARACGEDHELRASVERFLAADASGEALVDASFESLASPLLDPDRTAPEALAPGTRIGRYRLLDLLGTGGMGTVYRAERADGAYERQVALKMVRSGRLLGRAEERFQRERQILARLSHPGIATLLDGGLTEDERPYLVMELVKGDSITEFARRQELGVAGRLQLVFQVVDAVEYAHRNLVVHRDLKPSNILVTEDGIVKLLDFGIARLDAEEGETRTGLLLLTPDYAAPEQIRGEAVTTATDVYAIGAILYELLALKKPFGRISGSWQDLERILQEDPPPLSHADGVDRATRKGLAGDLETIVRKAMHKDPVRRYATARAFGDDLRRFLEARPVAARPDSLGYTLSRFVARNRAASITALALAMALVAGGAGTLWQAREARIQAERGQAVGDFLFSLFEGADPDLHPGEPVTALELVDVGVARIDSLDAGPEARVDLLTTLGALLGRLGELDRSEALLRRAVSEAAASLSPGDAAHGTALDALGVRLSGNGEYEEAEEVLAEALERRRADEAPTAEIAATLGNLAATRRNLGLYEDAEADYREALHLLSPGTDSTGVASELMGLAQTLQHMGRAEEAESLFRTVRRLLEGTGAETPLRAFAVHNLGVLLGERGEFEQAEQLHREALETWRRIFPGGHPEVSRSLEAIGRVAALQGRWQEADSLYDEAIRQWSVDFGEGEGYLATVWANQANIRYQMGEFEAAAAAYRNGIRVWRQSGDRRILAAALRNLGIIEMSAGNTVEAEARLQEALEMRRELNGDLHTSVAETHSSLAFLHVVRSRFIDAETEARAALDQYAQLVESDYAPRFNTLLALGIALVGQQRCGEAIPILTEVLARFEETLNPADVLLGRARLWLGVCQARAGDVDQARELLSSARPVLEARMPEGSPEMRELRAWGARVGA